MHPLEWLDVKTPGSVVTDIAYTPGRIRFGQIWFKDNRWILYLADPAFGPLRTEFMDKKTGRFEARSQAEASWKKFNEYENHDLMP